MRVVQSIYPSLALSLSTNKPFRFCTTSLFYIHYVLFSIFYVTNSDVSGRDIDRLSFSYLFYNQIA